MSNDYSACNDAELARIWHEAKSRIERLELVIDTEKEIIKEVSAIASQRLVDSGATAINTPYGTIHTVGRTTAKIVDPALCRRYVIEGRHWDGLDWKINAVWARQVIEDTGAAIPGVELSTFRRLSITAPKPQKRLANVE